MLHIYLHLHFSPEKQVLLLNTQETSWLLFSHPSLPRLEIRLSSSRHTSPAGSSTLHGSAHLQSSQGNASPSHTKHCACTVPLIFRGIF